MSRNRRKEKSDEVNARQCNVNPFIPPSQVDSFTLKNEEETGKYRNKYNGTQTCLPIKIFLVIFAGCYSLVRVVNTTVKPAQTRSSRTSQSNYGLSDFVLSHLSSKKDLTGVAVIGIQKGRRLAALSDLFPNVTIHGFDAADLQVGELQSHGGFKEGHIKLHYFNQTDRPTLLLSDVALFSIVIDGGLHGNDQTAIRTWEEFSPQMMPNSIYVVEGCECREFQRHLAAEYPDMNIKYTAEGPNSPMILLHPTTSTAASFKSRIASSIDWKKWCWKTFPAFEKAPFYDKHAMKTWVPTVRPNLKMAAEYAHVDKADDMTFEFLERLPKSYVMKASHLHRVSGVILVDGEDVRCLSKCRPKQKGETKGEFIKRMCDTFLSIPPGGSSPTAFSLVKPRCIFEEQLPFAGKQGLRDFKVHVYHQKPMFVYISKDQYNGSRTTNSRTPDWKEIPFLMSAGQNHPRDELGERPAFLDSMLDDATALYAAIAKSVNLSFVRVDFLEFNSSYAFGEFKFHHEACSSYCDKPMADKFYGFVATHSDLNIPANAVFDVF
mmetsp:Transcript_17895/g.29616  ORF Transcript_17895/g.29616 Transcript_17895/m.29616 type:complete len:549 (-) Transcript_17895:903-2549(-)